MKRDKIITKVPQVILIGGLTFLSILFSCHRDKATAEMIQGKVERDEMAVVGKVAGRIEQILVEEGDRVKKGDTLAILDVPEIDAKKRQAQGAVKSAQAQYEMSVRGATTNQLTQLNAKKTALHEQYEFAKKSLDRLEDLVQDSLIPQQQYDEVYAKYQGAKAQLAAVNAEIADVEHGVRPEQQIMAKGQEDRALGALEEARIADGERYILAPQDMSIETITLQVGELALPGYTLFKGSLEQTVYFRFTVAETQLKGFSKGQDLRIYVPYMEKELDGTITNVKQIGAYANIATAYPDYDMQDPLYEVIVKPRKIIEAVSLYSKATVTVKQ